LLLNAKLLVSCFASLWLPFGFLNYVLWSAFVTLTSQDFAIHPNIGHGGMSITVAGSIPDCGCGQLDLLDFLCMHELIPMVPCYVLLVLFIGTVDVTCCCSGASYVSFI
jgi:hypothetical protein